MEARIPSGTASDTLVYYAHCDLYDEWCECKPWRNPGLPSFTVYSKSSGENPAEEPVWDQWITLMVPEDVLTAEIVHRAISDFLGKPISLFVGCLVE